MSTLPVVLDRTAAGSLAGQLSGRIRDLVVAGTLTRGDRLPSSRALAARPRRQPLGRRAGLRAAARRGLARGAPGRGHVRRRDRRRARASHPARRSAPAAADLVRLDAGTPWIDPRHAAGWRRAWREVSTARPPRGYDDPRGLPELRAALAERLGRTRGLVVDPDEVVLTNGTTDALRHLLTVLPPGPVALEDPGYRAAVETVRGVGRETRDLPALAPVDRPDRRSPRRTSRPRTSTRSAG